MGPAPEPEAGLERAVGWFAGRRQLSAGGLDIDDGLVADGLMLTTFGRQGGERRTTGVAVPVETKSSGR